MRIEWAPVPVEPADEIADEPLGTKEKYWVVNPSDESVWLFKLARVRHGRTLGEDWAEWIVHHLAGELGVPSAEIRPAMCEAAEVSSRAASTIHPGASGWNSATAFSPRCSRATTLRERERTRTTPFPQ